MNHFNKLFALILCVICGSTVQAQTNSRELRDNWQFVRMDMANAWEVFRPVQAGKPESVPLWTDVTLPHCWNAIDAVDPDCNYYQGAGFYRTYLHIDNPYHNGRTLLVFDGAGQKSDVYVYTQKVGSHVGGYDKWRVDITDAVRDFQATDVYKSRFEGKIPVAVRCDNSRDVEMIPSDMSDFNLYGGLYRPVHLVYVPQLHISNTVVTPTQGALTVNADIQGLGEGTLDIEITDPEGKVAASAHDIKVKAGLYRSDVLKVKKPQLWDVATPRLYTCKLSLKVDGETVDYHEKFGFRTYEFREHGPFYLNGKRLLLQGTHRHEDHAGVAAAMTREQIYHDMLQMKEMGVNFIRLGHYQQSDYALELCDSLGILVWEEIPWCRGGLGGEKYRIQAKNMLENMIAQHRNHPSVILWGLGNENDWPGDFTEFDKDSIHAFMSELNDIAHKADPSRKTSIRRCDFCADVVDVYSPTIWAGWYSRSMFDYKEMEEDAIGRFPRFFHAEWGGDSHAGRHAESDFKDMVQADKYGDWSETYMVRLFDWCLKEQQSMPNLTGTAFWTFKDFSTPLRPNNPIPYVNQKGVMQRDGTPKESYYVFQSYWTKKPMIHIYGHSWQTRWGKAGESREVLVYSNCDEVELFLNGKSLGKKKRNVNDYPAAGFHWDAVYKEGNNSLKAIGYSRSGRVEDCIEQEYQTAQWAEPNAVEVSVEPAEQGIILIKARVVDAKGITCLDAANRITFGITGDGTLLDNMGTANGTRKIQAANGCAEIRAKVYGSIAVSASSPQLKSGVMLYDDNPNIVDSAFRSAAKQLTFALECIENAKKTVDNPEKFSPRTMEKDGSLRLVKPRDWCSGFFAGELWQMFRYTNDPQWERFARQFTDPIEKIKDCKETHDLGFILYNSFGKGYELTGDTVYRNIIVQAANSLISRYSKKVGAIRSWEHHAHLWNYPVIIDNMLNLELLFRASLITGDNTYYNIAVNHANKTLANHFRADNSCYHVVSYNPETGMVEKKNTHQGLFHESVWSRGQGWAIYGYTMCYRYTNDKAYLEQAQKVAKFIFSQKNMPKDLIPYWDMLDPAIPNAPRDASAAAVTASALYELATFVGKEDAKQYRKWADTIVNSLYSSDYRNEVNTKQGFLLDHSTGNYPANDEIDKPISYADYYYLEAMWRKATMR